MKILKIKFNTNKFEDNDLNHNTIDLMVWQVGLRYKVIHALLQINTEITILTQGTRLILKDDSIKFYRSFVPGDMIKIPNTVMILEDEFEPIPPPPCDSEEVVAMMREWGLLPKG